MKAKIYSSIALTSLFGPLVAFAQNWDWVTLMVEAVSGVLSSFIPLFIGIALLVFIWGVVRFISADDDSSRSDGKKKIVWGIVGLFIIVSVWGFVILLQTLLGINNDVPLAEVPNIPGIVVAPPED